MCTKSKKSFSFFNPKGLTMTLRNLIKMVIHLGVEKNSLDNSAAFINLTVWIISLNSSV